MRPRPRKGGFSTAGLNEVQVPAASMKEQLGHVSLKTTQEAYVPTMLQAKRRVVGAYEDRYLKGLFDRQPSEQKGGKRTKARASRRRKR